MKVIHPSEKGVVGMMDDQLRYPHGASPGGHMVDHTEFFP